jgi:hypothetical protein
MSTSSPSIRSAFFLASLLALFTLAGARPTQAARRPVGDGPEFVFPFAPELTVYWLPRDRTFVYYRNGDYFRWQGGHWVHAAYSAGPWEPLPPGFVLPRVLDSGPPPPIRTSRAYFIWWRLHHPHWWTIYHADLSHYRFWREKAPASRESGSRFGVYAVGTRPRSGFVLTHPDLYLNLPRQTIGTHHLSDRYDRSLRSRSERTHPWSPSGHFGNEGGYTRSWSTYPTPWSALMLEGGYGSPRNGFQTWFPGLRSTPMLEGVFANPWTRYGWDPWVQSFGTWYAPGENQPLSPWVGNPLFAPWNAFPY